MTEEDVAFENNNRALLTIYFGKDLDYSSTLDNDSDHETNKGPVVLTTFILPLLFQLKPSIEKVIGEDNITL